MATKTYSINTQSVSMADFEAGLAKSFGYQEQVPNESGQMVPNPESRSAFNRKMILRYIQYQYQAGIVEPAVKVVEQDTISSIPKFA